MHPPATRAVPAAPADGRPLLELRGSSRFFGGVHALEQVSMGVRAGTVHGLIGPNGAGKTTLVNLLTGLHRPSAGQVLLDGRRLDGARPHRIARMGVARTFQNIRLFGNLPALENVLAGRTRHAVRRSLGRLVFLPAAAREDRAEYLLALDLLGRLGLDGRDRRPAGTLSYGDQRRVELARALALEPRVLVLDEPAAGMNREETDRLGRLIRAMVTPARAILLIEHDLPLIMAVCDTITVLNFGRVIAEGAPHQIAADPAVIEAYLGTDDDLSHLS
jgi:ABC-type branched-subunit amino acid transport system ATPase component